MYIGIHILQNRTASLACFCKCLLNSWKLVSSQQGIFIHHWAASPNEYLQDWTFSEVLSTINNPPYGFICRKLSDRWPQILPYHGALQCWCFIGRNKRTCSRLNQWDRDKMAVISQTTFSNAFFTFGPCVGAGSECSCNRPGQAFPRYHYCNFQNVTLPF